jgi:hypothetical protein
MVTVIVHAFATIPVFMSNSVAPLPLVVVYVVMIVSIIVMVILRNGQPA